MKNEISERRVLERLVGVSSEALSSNDPLGYLLDDAAAFSKEVAILYTRRGLLARQTPNRTPIPLFEPKMASLRGRQTECSIETVMELLEVGEHKFCTDNDIVDRRDVLSILRFAAKHLFTLNKDQYVAQKTWVWLQIRLAAATMSNLLDLVETDMLVQV